jgi:hypothetical protein
MDTPKVKIGKSPEERAACERVLNRWADMTDAEFDKMMDMSDEEYQEWLDADPEK